MSDLKGLESWNQNLTDVTKWKPNFSINKTAKQKISHFWRMSSSFSRVKPHLVNSDLISSSIFLFFAAMKSWVTTDNRVCLEFRETVREKSGGKYLAPKRYVSISLSD